MPCVMCKGQGLLESKLTSYIADLGTCVVVVRGVPSKVCRQCGEAYYSDNVLICLTSIIDAYRNTLTEVAIVTYRDNVA